MYVGCTLGGAIAFLLSRYFLRKTVRAYIRKKKMKIVRAVDISMKREGVKMSTLLRLVPYLPWNVFNYMAGVTGMRFPSYMVGSIGTLPWSCLVRFALTQPKPEPRQPSALTLPFRVARTQCTFVGSGLNSLDDAASGTGSSSDKRVNIGILCGGIVTTVLTTAVVTSYAKKALKESEEEAERPSASSFTFDESREPSRDVAGGLGGGAGGVVEGGVPESVRFSSSGGRGGLSSLSGGEDMADVLERPLLGDGGNNV
jgi:hypothetical protein